MSSLWSSFSVSSLLILFFFFSSYNNYVVDALCTDPNKPPITFGPSSSLFAKYTWSHPSTMFGALSVPVVLDVVGDARPEIFLSYYKPPPIPQCSITTTGFVVALHVVNGSLVPLWEITQLYTLPFSHLAVSKVPNSNEAIVCAFNSSGTSFFCADAATGVILLTQNMTSLYQCYPQVSTWSAISIERFFPDEVDPSLFIIAQSRVFRYDSTTRTTSFHCGIPWTPGAIDIPFAIDIDLDGTAELFSQQCVYKASDCSLLWCSSPSVRWIFPGVGNIDKSTPEPEVVMAGAGRIGLYDHKGHQLWNVSVSANNCGGPPAIADIDGDGVPDIGTSCSGQYFIVSGVDGKVLKNYTVVESSTVTGSSAFDFQNDGTYEMVYVSGSQTYIFSMNWTKTFSHSSGTTTEYSVIADIDLDGSADIIAMGSSPVKVLSSNDQWPDATNSWTTHGHNSMKLDRLNYPRVMKATSTFRSGDKLRSRAEIVSTIALNCSSVEVAIRNTGDYVLDPSSACVYQDGSPIPPTCNADAIPLGQTSFLRLPVIVATSSVKATINVTGPYLSSCQEDVRSASVMLPACPSLSPSVSYITTSTISHSRSPKHTPSITSPIRSTGTELPARRIGYCIGCEISDTSFTFDKRTTHQDVTLQLRSNNTLVGLVTIQAGTFPPGCTISANHSTPDPHVQKPYPLDCDPELQLSSVAVELNVYDSETIGMNESSRDSCESKGFRKPVLIKLFSEKVDPESACVAFRESDVGSDWNCLGGYGGTEKKDYLVLESETTHFTTFAVLFQASDSCDRWIWITSLSMVAFCFCFSLLMGGLYCGSKRVRAVVGGFKAKHISSVIKHAEVKK